jgi:hypothetical protein
LQACRIYAVQEIRKRLGIALETDSQGIPVTLVTKKNNASTKWFLTCDIQVRFPNKRSVLAANEQQRAPVRNKDDNHNHILTHDGHISPTLIPTGHVGNESTDSSLHKVFSSCELLRGKDSGELSALFRNNLNEIYEDLILNNDNDFHPPEDLIDAIVTNISLAETQNESSITLEPAYLLYLFEISRI